MKWKEIMYAGQTKKKLQQRKFSINTESERAVIDDILNPGKHHIDNVDFFLPAFL